MNGALWQLTAVRLREFFREPGTLFWVFAFPILLALGLGLAFKSGVKPKSPILVLQGPQAAARAQILEEEGSFLVRLADKNEANALLRSGKAILAVGGGEPVSFMFDPTHPEGEALRDRADDALQRAAGRRDVIETADVKITQQGSRYIDFLIPGLLGMNIMGSSMWGIGWVIVQNRTRKLLKRLVATPMRRRDYLLSHIIARLAFLAMEVAVMLAFAYWVFDVAVQGSWLAITLLSFVGAMSFAGIGLLVASRAKTAETVSGLMNAVMLPMWLLSGVFFSAENFPAWMQPFIQALPLTALNDGLRAVMNEGVGLIAVAGPLALLAAWGAVSFGVALKLFRWQ
jgi:ABC-type multidrug transport system permease subunit